MHAYMHIIKACQMKPYFQYTKLFLCQKSPSSSSLFPFFCLPHYCCSFCPGGFECTPSSESKTQLKTKEQKCDTRGVILTTPQKTRKCHASNTPSPATLTPTPIPALDPPSHTSLSSPFLLRSLLSPDWATDMSNCLSSRLLKDHACKHGWYYYIIVNYCFCR